jgi:hypothetical protein
VIPGRLAGRAIAGQEGDPEQVGDGVGQERAALQRPAHRVDRVLPQPLAQPADVRAQPGRPQEQRVKVQPQVTVVSRAQVEMPRPGPGQPDHLTELH